MTTGTKRRIDALLCALALALSAAAAGAAPAGFTVRQLMDALAGNASSRADFVEKKYLAALDGPLESSGVLVYAAPARLEKRTLLPRPESLIVDGGTLTVERNGSRHSIALASFPEVAVFTDSVRAVLAGDLDALSKSYRLTLAGSEAGWRLTLSPSDPKIAALVSRVTIDGSGRSVEAIEVLQADGSRSVTTMKPSA